MGFPDGSRPFWLANVWYGSTPRSLACNSLYMIYMQVACVTTNVPMHPFCMHPHKKQPNNLAPPAPKVSHFPHAKMVLCFLASYTKLFFRIYYTYMKVIYFLQLPENGKNNSVKFGWPGYQSWSNPSLSFPSSPNSSSPNYWCRLSCFVSLPWLIPLPPPLPLLEKPCLQTINGTGEASQTSLLPHLPLNFSPTPIDSWPSIPAS